MMIKEQAWNDRQYVHGKKKRNWVVFVKGIQYYRLLLDFCQDIDEINHQIIIHNHDPNNTQYLYSLSLLLLTTKYLK